MNPTISIIMPPILAKFLKYRQAITPTEPLRFPKQHFINKFLKANLTNINRGKVINLLENKRYDTSFPCKKYPPNMGGRKGGEGDGGNSSPCGKSRMMVTISIPNFSSWEPYHKKRFLTIERKRLFVKIIKAIYKYEFEQFYWTMRKEGKSKQKIADLWIEALHIDDEILPKSQWRAIYREIRR